MLGRHQVLAGATEGTRARWRAARKPTTLGATPSQCVPVMLNPVRLERIRPKVPQADQQLGKPIEAEQERCREFSRQGAPGDS